MIRWLNRGWKYVVWCRCWICSRCGTANEEREFFCGCCAALEPMPPATVKRQKRLFE